MVLVSPFLSQIIRYRCPNFGIFKFYKPKLQCFKRHIWQYEHDDYDRFRALASSTDWNQLDIDVYAFNITDKILSLAKECTPNIFVMIQPWALFVLLQLSRTLLGLL